MRDRAGKLDMAHALAAHFGYGNFDTALFADDATVLQALVLAAKALVVFDWAEYLGAEQAVALGLECTVVDRFGLANFPKRPRPHFLGRSDADLDVIELLGVLNSFRQIGWRFHYLRSLSMSRDGYLIAFSRTLNESGIPASMTWSSL